MTTLINADTGEIISKRHILFLYKGHGIAITYRLGLWGIHLGAFGIYVGSVKVSVLCV